MGIYGYNYVLELAVPKMEEKGVLPTNQKLQLQKIIVHKFSSALYMQITLNITVRMLYT